MHMFYLLKVSLRGIFCSYWVILNKISYFKCKQIKFLKKITLKKKNIISGTLKLFVPIPFTGNKILVFLFPSLTTVTISFPLSFQTTGIASCISRSRHKHRDFFFYFFRFRTEMQKVTPAHACGGGEQRK